MARRKRIKFCMKLVVVIVSTALLTVFLVLGWSVIDIRSSGICQRDDTDDDIDINLNYFLSLEGFENTDNINVPISNSSSNVKQKVRNPEDKELKLRFQNYQNVCTGKELVTGRTKDRSISQHFQLCPRYNIIYCSIEKAGTTFLRRLLQVWNADILSSPFFIHPKDGNKRNKALGRADFYELLGKFRASTVFTFVRNPYSRLLSGYLDKIYSANPYYWSTVGVEMVDGIHKKNGCYSSVSFQQFINYIIKAESEGKRRRDVHFMSMYDLCKPCQVNYDFIGRLETFQRDLFYLIDKFNLTRYKPVLGDIVEDSFDDQILDISTALEERRKDIVKCISMHEAYQRSWRSLQIRGLISIDKKYPFTQSESYSLDSKQFMKALKKAHLTSKSTTNLKRQKSEMFRKVYSSIPLETMTKLSDVLKLDFEIFGYEPRPFSLFNRTGSSTGIEENVFKII